MRSTRILAAILISLIITMIVYVFSVNYHGVNTYITKQVQKYKKSKTHIPSESYNHRTYNYITVSETDNFEPENIEDIKKIYYTVLNNGWTSFTFYCDPDYVTCVDDVRQIADSNYNPFISIINNYVSPFNSYKKYNTYIINNNEINLTIERLYTNAETAMINIIMDEYFEKNTVSTPATKNDIKKIHDYIIKKTTYDNDYVKGNEITDSSKATGALIKGKALCSGYSDAFAAFLDRIGVPNFEITSEEHEWNVVYYDNKWQHIDVTWDDDETNRDNTTHFFMINSTDLFKKDKKEHNFDNKLFLELK